MRISRLRTDSSVAVLGSATIGALLLGILGNDVAAGAGLVLLGTAVTRAIDVNKETVARVAAHKAERRRDLDETRRLAYAALLVGPAPANFMLAGTLVNALVHHGLAIDEQDAMNKVTLVVNRGDATTAATWLQAANQANIGRDEDVTPTLRGYALSWTTVCALCGKATKRVRTYR
jgi:hypothetical protein